MENQIAGNTEPIRNSIRLFALSILSVVLFFIFMPCTAQADDAFVIEGSVLKAYTGAEENVVIPAGS